MEGLQLKIAGEGGGASDKNRRRGKAVSLQLWGEEVKGEGRLEAFSAVMFLHCISQNAPVSQTLWAGLCTVHHLWSTKLANRTPSFVPQCVK